ncbi:MAG: GNAT family N-acetyltransferase [Chloroflexia bacterium]|nr:GNAT family N-acetyltransferase [Chloroflexia bacterium]
MSQPPHIDVIAPSGDADVDGPLFDGIRHYLTRQEIVNTIQLSGFIARGEFDATHPVLAAVAGEDMVGVATVTPGFLLLLSHVETGLAIPALVRAAIQAGLDVPGVMGPRRVALAFAEGWAEATGDTLRPGMTQRILVARAVEPPGNVPGTWRLMEPGDRSVLVSWFTAFNREADDLTEEQARRQGKAMVDRLDDRSGAVLWLDQGGAPVSIACYKAPTMNGIRIGPVYTPPEHRRRGYAGAVTAAVTRLLLDRSFEFTCLYTNAANATANHVYEAIGYEFVADSMQYRFEASS